MTNADVAESFDVVFSGQGRTPPRLCLPEHLGPAGGATELARPAPDGPAEALHGPHPEAGDVRDPLRPEGDPMNTTPGPWTTGGIFDPNGPDPRTNIWGKTPRGAQSGHIIAQDVRLHDARLIASAPDLLVACKMALNERMFKDWPEVATALIAAIAKAEGTDTP